MLHRDACDEEDIGECDCGCGEVSEPLLNKIIVLDPGHGGIYSGGVHYGFRESDINLSVGLKLCQKLARLGAKVIMTRTRDVNLAPPGSTLDADLQARVDVAKTSGADIFVSLHVDDVPNINLSGAASYFPMGRSSGLASTIQTSLINETCAVDNGVSPADFYVLVHNDIPAALIEMGYLSNPAEALCLMNNCYQNLIANGILNGIINYFLCQ
ncbi:n-acetylmuramoyl-l-alanine amidase [Lucifera butyrica]|uniref:N-acetylmuramoyl-l-alanine amidase n=1 Tax=Lucifera butyrica TaxID=1351585 RepID=A0A498QXU4_9FIRM|nr:N-acetylmuramoyl-L-alanine amidase [Lucifera butyrica]VBB04976.1 n-acetylmuramoyl-l-alanine amidase [Lucifera butyrica]